MNPLFHELDVNNVGHETESMSVVGLTHASFTVRGLDGAVSTAVVTLKASAGGDFYDTSSTLTGEGIKSGIDVSSFHSIKCAVTTAEGSARQAKITIFADGPFAVA